MRRKLWLTTDKAIVAMILMFAATGALAQETHRFSKPMHQNYRLDWCLDWSKQCGKPAASAWCRAQGYSRAKLFDIAEDIGDRSPTKVFRSGQICKDRFCDGFSFITCERLKKPIAMVKPSAGFTGAWRNIDADTRSITRIEISPTKGDRFSVHVWGQCQPRDCDWGKRTATRKANRLQVTWDQKFAQRKMAIKLKDSRLMVLTRSVYRDNRPDKVSRDTFERQTPGAKGGNQAGTQHRLGVTALRGDKPGEALRHFQQAAELYRRAGHRQGQAGSLIGVAACYDAMDKGGVSEPQKLANSKQALNEALEIVRASGDRSKTWRVLFNLGVIHEKQNEDARALAYYREALHVSTGANERQMAEFFIGCRTQVGKGLSAEFSGRLECPKAAFGSMTLLFDDEDEEW